MDLCAALGNFQVVIVAGGVIWVGQAWTNRTKTEPDSIYPDEHRSRSKFNLTESNNTFK